MTAADCLYADCYADHSGSWFEPELPDEEEGSLPAPEVSWVETETPF